MYTIDAEKLANAFISGANRLCNKKNILNDLNVFPVPDGDTGSNMSMTVLAAARELSEKNPQTAGSVMDVIAGASLRGARGNSGVILSQLFRGMARAVKEAKIIDKTDICRAFSGGVETAYRAVMKPTEGTMLTVSRDAAKCGEDSLEQTDDIIDFLEKVTDAAQKSLDRTPEILPQLKAAGVVDSGGQGVVYLLEGLLSYLKTGEMVPLEDASSIGSSAPKAVKIANEEIKYGYCTEFLIEKNNPKASTKLFGSNIQTKGDSMVIVDDEEIVKVHIHTNNPGYVIEQALKLGQLINIKIDNMRYQHNSIMEEKEPETKEPETKEPAKKYGFAAVAAGDGITEIFRDMSIDEIIPGGQTMNPSTDDILSAIEKVNAENVYVFPNNKNIILAAEQAAELSDKNVIVIPTKSIPEGVSAMLAFLPTLEPDANKNAMITAASLVKTGSVTYAVRDTNADGKDIKEGDILGVHGKEILAVGSSPEDVLKELAANMADDDGEILSVYYGEDVTKETAEEITEFLEEEYPDYDVVVHRGGQPLYYYIISVE
ncbi:MAG: DAK2 domain-containing protein [Clostridia bacterium]|nr:DAK2 domain-containing protein [Clostridia bacterium]